MRTRLMLPTLAVICAAVPVGAQTALNWEQVKARFASANPTLRAGELNISESKTLEITAFLKPNPNVTVSADQFDPFSETGEHDRVLPNNVSAPNGLNSDLRVGALSDESMPRIDSDLSEVPVQRPGNKLGKLDRRSAWSIFLKPVMGFDYFDIKIIPEQACRIGDHFEKNIHTDTHIRRKNAWDPKRQFCGFVELIRCKAGRAYNHRLSGS